MLIQIQEKDILIMIVQYIIRDNKNINLKSNINGKSIVVIIYYKIIYQKKYKFI